MVKHVVLAVAMIGGLVLVDQAEARHGRRGGCGGGACYSGGYYGGYHGGCAGGVCGVPVGPAYPAYPSYPSAPMKAAVVPAVGPVAVAPVQPAPAPVVVAPSAQRYYYTNAGRLGWRRGR
jgi:hypothetical protein